jgi:triphosphoribosyl-dephospho-CoA synthetase
MIDSRDTLAAAQLMIKRYGEDAALEAAKRADELLKAGDLDGGVVWQKIVHAIDELQRNVREPGEAVH